MREDVSDLLDRAVGWYEPNDAPDAAPIADVAGRRRRRRRVNAIALSAVITVGSLAFVVFALAPRTAQEPPAGSGLLPTPADQVVAYHGLELTVPVSWKINDTRCGTPQGDTVIRDQGGTPACLTSRPPGVSSVEFVENPSYWLSQLQSDRTLINPNGAQLERGTITDRPGIAVYAPEVGVLMLVDTVTDEKTQAIIDSIQISDTDPNGCAMKEMQLDPPASYRPDPSMRAAMIPGAPSAIAVCHFVDNWLVSSATLTDREMTDLVRVANALPEGFVHPPPANYNASQCRTSSAEGGESGGGIVLWVHEGDAAPTPLWAHVGFCGHLGITNGARDGQLTPDLAAALFRPLHAGYEFSGQLIPDGPAG